MEAAAVSLSLPSPLPPPHHHRSSLPIPILPQTNSRPRVCSSSSSSKPPRPATDLSARSAQAFHPATAHFSSSRATTGYAAALADACVRAGTLRRAARHARALLLLPRRHQSSSRVVVEQVEEPRVAALVRMLVGKGRTGMVTEVMAEFAAICDKLLLPQAATRAH